MKHEQEKWELQTLYPLSTLMSGFWLSYSKRGGGRRRETERSVYCVWRAPTARASCKSQHVGAESLDRSALGVTASSSSSSHTWRRAGVRAKPHINRKHRMMKTSEISLWKTWHYLNGTYEFCVRSRYITRVPEPNPATLKLHSFASLKLLDASAWSLANCLPLGG